MLQATVPHPTPGRDQVADPAPPKELPRGMRLGDLRLKFTTQGQLYFRECGVPIPDEHAMKMLWRDDKMAFAERGFKMRWHNGRGYLEQWLRKNTKCWELSPDGQTFLNTLRTPDELPMEFDIQSLELPTLPPQIENKLFD